MKKYIFGFLAALMTTATSAATTIKIATVAPDGTAWMRELRAAAESIKTKTVDRVEIKFYPGGVMGDESAVMRKMKIGQLQGGAFTGGEISAVVKDAQIYSLPFLFKTQDEIDKVRADLDPLLKKSFEQAGYEALGITGGGFAYLMSVKQIKNKDDLKAAKVWVPQGDHVAEAGFKAGGVTPIPLPLADVYTSLQTGLIDTAASTPSGAIAFQWHTKIKYMVDLPLTYVVGIIVVDKKVFDGLSAEDQKTVSDEFGNASQRLDKANRDDNTQARDALQKQGITVFKPSADDVAQWDSVGVAARKQLMADGEITPDMAAALDKSLAKVRGSK